METRPDDFGPKDEKGEAAMNALEHEAAASDPALAAALDAPQDSATIAGIAESAGAIDPDADPVAEEAADAAAREATEAADED
jgi:hypothetical protein